MLFLLVCFNVLKLNVLEFCVFVKNVFVFGFVFSSIYYFIFIVYNMGSIDCLCVF